MEICKNLEHPEQDNDDLLFKLVYRTISKLKDELLKIWEGAEIDYHNLHCHFLDIEYMATEQRERLMTLNARLAIFEKQLDTAYKSGCKQKGEKTMTETKPSLLVVDDSAENIYTLLDTLGKNYSVRVVTDGNAALSSVKKITPDLILLDIMMPGMDGFEVCRRLKDEPATQDIPIIFITTMNEDADEARGLALGAVDYITKPFNTAIVNARVRNHLELRRQKRELQKSYDKLREVEALRDSLVVTV